MIAPMPYTRRPTGPDTDREDYVIRCEARDVGRVYRRRLPEGIDATHRGLSGHSASYPHSEAR